MPNLPGSYDIYARVPASPSSPSEAFAVMTAVGATGSQQSLNLNQRESPGQWKYIATADLGGTQQNYVLLQTPVSTGDLLADAVAYVPTRTFPTATWTNAKSGAPLGHTQVIATWGYDATRATRVVYGVQSYKLSGFNSCTENPTIMTTVDQTLPGTGVLIGTVDTTALCSTIRVTVTPDNVNGTLSADSIQLVTP